MPIKGTVIVFLTAALGYVSRSQDNICKSCPRESSIFRILSLNPLASSWEFPGTKILTLIQHFRVVQATTLRPRNKKEPQHKIKTHGGCGQSFSGNNESCSTFLSLIEFRTGPGTSQSKQST